MDQNVNPDIMFHCIQVSMKATELAEKINMSAQNVDTALCTIGGLLHDVGRIKTHTIFHGLEGAKIIRKKKWPESLALIAERHIGGGISQKETIELGFPAKNYLPVTLEEKIVCYADKLFIYTYDDQNRIIEWKEVQSCLMEVDKLRKRLGGGHLAPDRLLNLEKELKPLFS